MSNSNEATAEKNSLRIAYQDFAKKAREQGFNAIAMVFENIATTEKQHEHSQVKQ
ncbi:MAG: hypothetical protein HQK77_19845 [Desulfobacterales bacterium]|nr:hypothetical protein [Desulfobacterales bacterium]